MSKDNDSLKNLPPEERIRRLKALEKEKEKEIEEARKKIRESQEELSEKRRWFEKVPIPELAKDSMEGLSEEAKIILKERKGLKEKAADEKKDVEAVIKSEEVKGKFDLESLAQERVDVPPELLESEYTKHLSRRPMADLYNEIAGINKTVEEKGYINADEERRVEYIASAVERKVEDAGSGKYSFTEDVAAAASLSRQMGNKLRNLYQSGGNVDYQM